MRAGRPAVPSSGTHCRGHGSTCFTGGPQGQIGTMLVPQGVQELPGLTLHLPGGAASCTAPAAAAITKCQPGPGLSPSEFCELPAGSWTEGRWIVHACLSHAALSPAPRVPSGSPRWAPCPATEWVGGWVSRSQPGLNEPCSSSVGGTAPPAGRTPSFPYAVPGPLSKVLTQAQGCPAQPAAYQPRSSSLGLRHLLEILEDGTSWGSRWGSLPFRSSASAACAHVCAKPVRLEAEA